MQRISEKTAFRLRLLGAVALPVFWWGYLLLVAWPLAVEMAVAFGVGFITTANLRRVINGRYRGTATHHRGSGGRPSSGTGASSGTSNSTGTGGTVSTLWSGTITSASIPPRSAIGSSVTYINDRKNRAPETIQSPIPILAQRWANLKWYPGKKKVAFGSVAYAGFEFGAEKTQAFHQSSGALTGAGDLGNHVGPEYDCTCGWYAYPYDGVNFDYERLGQHTPAPCILVVELRGKIIEHSLGYRAEYQQVLKVYMEWCCVCGRNAEPDKMHVIMPNFTDGNLIVSICSGCFNSMKALYLEARARGFATPYIFKIPKDTSALSTPVTGEITGTFGDPTPPLIDVAQHLYQRHEWGDYSYMTYVELGEKLGVPVEARAMYTGRQSGI